MKRLIALIAVIAIASIGSLSATQTATSASPISQQTVAAQPVTVRIQHTWKQWQGGALLDFKDESLGTIIAPDLIFTHNHFSQPVGRLPEEAFYFEDDWGRSIQWRPRDLRLTTINAGTMLIRLPVGVFSGQASVVDRPTLRHLTVGTWLTTHYWDSTAGQVAQHSFQIIQVKDGVAKLADPDRLIKPGDSGGGAFFENRLIGNTWSIDTDGDGHVLGTFNIALVPFQVAN